MNKSNKVSNLETLNCIQSVLLLGVSMYAFVLYLSNINQKAEIEYLQAFTKHIETKGLAHWNNWYYYGIKERTPEQIIRTVFPENQEQMLKIAACESGMNPKARNKNSSARGLFQVMASVHQVKEQWLYEPLINALIARELYEASGTNPWISSIKCWNK